MTNLTPDEINEILDEYFNDTFPRTYIGKRYVPILGRKGEDTIEWDDEAPYEPLTIVTYEGNTYTSRQYVPTGIPINDTDFWVLTGNYNIQVQTLNTVLPITEFDEVNTVKSYIDAINDALPINEFDSENNVKEYIDSLNEALPISEYNGLNTVKDSIDSIIYSMPLEEFDPEYTIKDYIDELNKYQSDLQNNLVEIQVCNQLPSRSGYSMLGMCLDSSNVYVLYLNGSKTMLSKYSPLTNDASSLTLIDEIQILRNNGGTCVNISNGKLLITSKTVFTNRINVVDIESFTQESDILIPYRNIINCDVITIDDTEYIIGHASETAETLLYQYDNLSRPDEYIDLSFKNIMSVTNVKGCCANNGQFYQLYSFNEGASSYKTNYIACYTPNSNGIVPSIFPIGHFNQINDICVYDGKMYCNSNNYIYSLGTKIVSSTNQFNDTNVRYYHISRIGYSVSEYMTGNIIPSQITLNQGITKSSINNRIWFRIKLGLTDSQLIYSPWYSLETNTNYSINSFYNIQQNIIDSYWIMIGNRTISSGKVTYPISVFGKTRLDENGVDIKSYPSFEVTSLEFEFKAVDA